MHVTGDDIEQAAAPRRKRKYLEFNPPTRGLRLPNQPPKNTPLDKRRKFQDAREIASQTPEEAFRGGQFETVSFVNSREFEIKSLLRSMTSSKNSQRKRAFQSLPRDLRRRTAAHNASRVPNRVRSIARLELIDDNTTLSRKRRDYRASARRLNANQLRNLSQDFTNIRGKSADRAKPSKPQNSTRSRVASRSSRYSKRQRYKSWLPTHIWCAKRARMTTRWGFALPETPNLKCYRSTYRTAARDGCVAFDTSYHATLLLDGPENQLKKCLMRFLPPRDLAIIGRTVVSGETAVSTWVYEAGKWPVGTMAPVRIFWCPDTRLPEDASEIKGHNYRKLIIRTHPSAWDDVWGIVAASAAASNCCVHNLRFEIGSIGLTGPKSTNILKFLMRTGSVESKIDPESSHLNTVLHDAIEDPRFNCYHDRGPVPTVQPHDTNPRGVLFDTHYRTSSVNTQVSQKTLTAQITQIVLENRTGPSLRNPVPLVLINEPLGEQADSNRTEKPPQCPYDSWSIILPWKWVRSFWLVLVRMGGVKFGGLKELEQLTLEARRGIYPVDFPLTPAGVSEAVRSHSERLDQEKRNCSMKTRGSESQSWAAGSSQIEAKYGYPWDKIFGSTINASANDGNSKLWNLSPDTVPLFSHAVKGVLPSLVSLGCFTVHIQVLGRGHIGIGARIYKFSKPELQVLKKITIHCASSRTAEILNAFSIHEKQKLEHLGEVESSGAMLVEETQWDDHSLIGFVIRANFGYKEGTPVATAALAWSKVETRVGFEKDHCAGWCIVKNKEGGIVQLAKWTAI
ncbi:hypothetical protein TWF694_002217 [Orbilia ellipsospora]|uniref:Uncharacterized protein n=1 Tax=Orbilia ellipsospora TaxID=2528407 RepID=A0AAV9X1E2_9PEZI